MAVNEEELNRQLNALPGDEPPAQDDPQEHQEQQVVNEDDDPPQTEARQPQVDDDDDDRPLSRREQRIQKLANERAEALQQAAYFRAKAEELAQRQQQPPVPEDLDPMQKWQRETNQALTQHQRMTLDALDQANFKLELVERADLREYAAEVEQRLQQIRANGGNLPRKEVLKFILGERAMERMAKAPKKREEAATRVRQAAGKPLNPPSSVQSGRQETTLYDRLKDIPL